MIKALLWDVDGTLMDFQAAEREAMKTCTKLLGLPPLADEEIAIYSQINDRYWKRLERGEITKQEVLVGRFVEFFALRGLTCGREVAEAFNKEYQVRLGDTICYNDDSYELVRALRGTVKQYAVTNGTAKAQERKMKNSGFGALMDGVFISDQIGCEKPGKGFFDHVFANIPAFDRREIMIVGDSLTSDIRGGNGVGIVACWYNPRAKENTPGEHVDYEIRSLSEIPALLKTAT